LCYVKDGRWVNVEGNPKAGNNYGRGSRSLCAKGNAAMQTVYDPSRIMYPMKRVGAKGEGKFERCTWDEGLAAVAAKLKEVKEKYGPEAYAVLSPQAYQTLWTHGRRFLNVYGSPNYCHSAICALQRAASKRISIGNGDCNPAQMDKCKLLVIWGADPENSAVNQGKPYERVRAIDNGLTVIDIRPMMDPLAAKAQIWVPIRPGTDCALALAILHVIIGEDLYDHEFVENWTNGFDKLAEHVKQFTPAWAAERTGLDEELIWKIARMMGTTKPMGILYGNGIGDQQSDGNWEVIAVCLIEAITGNLAIPGGGGAAKATWPSLIKTNKYDILTDRLQASEEDKAKGYYAGMAKLVAPETPRWYQNPKTWESGPNSAYFKALNSILTEKPYPIRVVLGQCSNPFGATRQPKIIKQALEKLEFYFVHDTHWNSSCDYADYVFPAANNYEVSAQFATKNSKAGTFIGINQVIVEPQGECRGDWQFYEDLAMAMGYGDDFWGGDMDKCLEEQLAPSGFTLKDLREAPDGIFVERDPNFTPAPPAYKNYETLFAQLPGGKVQCYNEWIGGKPNSLETGTLGFLPEYSGPPEGIFDTPEIAKDYPLIITDVHAYRLCNHSYYVGLPYLRELQPYPWCRINPATAQKYGIADGDWMKIESPHGWIKLKAEYFEGISPEVLMCRRGWWQDCKELDLPGYGCFDGGSDSTVLYNTEIEKFDPFHSAMSKQTLVRISKIEGGN
jgi:anaerobic selenocysteine-containing dehydrogenase